MLWLIIQMLLCLLIAFIIGCIVGCWFCKRRSAAHIGDGSYDANYSGSGQANLSSSGDFDANASANLSAEGDVDWDGDSLEAQLARCRSDLADANLEIDQLRTDLNASGAASASGSASIDADASASADATSSSSMASNFAASDDEDSDDGDYSLESNARPDALSAPKGGSADDLQRIKGIGPKLEKTLHGLGIYHFDQIANFNRENVKWVDGYLTFKGRIDREDWIGQAKILAKGGTTEFSNRYDKKS